ncbi:hypothetical protein C8R45DRAFT_374064 [Mycena sanguinolenta]|nr:hypothetical protein C8R45DRAFT_374064 [Mycena sanguinolenta]
MPLRPNVQGQIKPSRVQIWHDDGSVVLQAESTQFRVHWTVLCLHSTVFRDMRGIPQPEDDEPTIEGCPVIPLHDSSVDIKHLLDVLYDPLLCSMEKLSLAIIGALI